MSLLTNIIYFQDNRDLLRDLLDELIESAKPEADDEPPFRFATLIEAMGRDRDKAVTVAALALMRLGELKAGDPA